MRKNSVTISYPAKGANLYYFSFSDGAFPHIIAKRSDTIFESVNCESLYPSGTLDKFKNKGVIHFGLRGSLSLSLMSKGLTRRTVSRSDYSLCFINNGSDQIVFWTPGTGPIYNNWIWDVITEDRLETSYTDNKGVRLFTKVSTMSNLVTNFTTMIATCDCTVEYTSPDPHRRVAPYKEKRTARIYKCGVYPGLDVSDVLDVKYSIISLVPQLKNKPSPVIPQSLATDFINSTSVPNINNYENLKDLRELSKMVPPILNLIKRRNIKSVAELHLWYKYSYKTTELDMKEAIRALSRHFSHPYGIQKWSRSYSSVSTGYFSSVTSRYTVYYQTFSQSIMSSLGLRFDTTNLWDLIPYSFVADWFVNLGEIFSQLDSVDMLHSIPIESVLVTTKSSSTVQCQSINSSLIFGSVRAFYFSRTQRSTLPIDPISVSLKNPSKHILDGAALIITKK